MINTVQNIDCLIGMQSIPDKSIDMILCDLPYGTIACKWDEVIPFQDLWRLYKRITKDDAAIVLTASQPFTSILVYSNLKMFKCEWIWEKDCAVNFIQAKNHPLKYHENVLVFGKGKIKYDPQMINALKPFNKRGSAQKKSGFLSNSLEGQIHDETNTLRYPSSIQYFSKPKHNSIEGALHPTQKPVSLFEYLIKTYTKEGETVLDNCMGSGTTAIACINTNRNYIGFEKDETYFNIITDRIKNHTVQQELFKG